MSTPRGSNWTRLEVEATVASYFDMLEMGLRGEAYSKTEYRNALLPLLGNRTPGAVERKHQNISAILIELGVPYISGYKPLGNYQALLRDVVVEQLETRRTTRAAIEAEIERAPQEPTIDDLLRALVEPPKPRPGVHPRRRETGTQVRAPVDYLLMEARNRTLGRAGEEFIVNLERARLEAAGKSRLAADVTHVSVSRGDGLGYDILSFEEDTRERLIEVKTTKFGEYTPFYVSTNELAVSHREVDAYHLYRVYAFGPAAKVYTRAGALDERFTLEPNSFIATIR